MRERPGHRGVPYAMEYALRALPVAQRAVLTSLAFEAQYGEPEIVEVRGVRVELDIGEALISYDGLADDLRVPAGLVRRAVASGERIGLIAVRRAIPPGDTGGDTYRGTPHGTPPTVVRFLRHREILWPPGNRDTPHGTGGDTGGDTIPQDTGHRSSSLRSEGAPRERRQRGQGAPAPEGFQRVVKHWFEAWELAGRGKHASLTQAEGEMLKTLLRELGADELEKRIDRAFGDSWFLERGDLGLFRKQVQRFAQAGGGANARRSASVALLPDLDPAWLESLDPATREVVLRDWAELRVRVTHAAYPDALPRLLEQARDSLVEQYDSHRPIAAGGAA